jgi:hypothetical protein
MIKRAYAATKCFIQPGAKYSDCMTAVRRAFKLGVGGAAKDLCSVFLSTRYAHDPKMLFDHVLLGGDAILLVPGSLRCVRPPVGCSESTARVLIHCTLNYLFCHAWRHPLAKSHGIDWHRIMADLANAVRPYSVEMLVDPIAASLTYYMGSSVPMHEALDALFTAFPGIRRRFTPEVMIESIYARNAFAIYLIRDFCDKRADLWMPDDVSASDIERIASDFCQKGGQFALFRNAALAQHFRGTGKYAGWARTDDRTYYATDNEWVSAPRMVRSHLIEFVEKRAKDQ